MLSYIRTTNCWRSKIFGSYRYDKADFNTAKNDANVCTHAHNEVEFINLPEMQGGFVVDEAEHGGYDYGRQHHNWSVMEQGYQE